MKPWSYDAGELNPNDIPNAYIYKNQNIEEYLRPSSHERKLFLIGAKGCGKTLLLRYKAAAYWDKMENDDQVGYRVSASNELVESLDFDIDTLSRKEMETLASLQVWKNVWKFSLTLIAIRRLKIALPDNLKTLDIEFPPHYRLSNIVTEIITNPTQYITSNFFRRHLNKMSALLNDLKFPFILFIDRLDQALDTLLSNDEYQYFDSGNQENTPFKVWQYAQFGLLLSSYNFATATNRHIKIFATARREALDVETQLLANITSFCTFLEYTKNELQEIFERNIRHTPSKFLNPRFNGDNLYQSFFGFEEMPHIQAKNERQEYRQENVFNFLLRHTFERPREIVHMGRRIYDQLLTKKFHDLPLEKKIERVRREVNDTSHDIILKSYLNEVIPSFRSEYLQECAKAFEQNLIHQENLQKVDQNIIDYLYRIGLIGYVRQGRQRFLPASKYIHNHSERIPKSSHYVLHPSLDHHLQQVREFHDFYNDSCIIGNGYPFYPPPVYLAKRNRKEQLSYYMPKELPGKGNVDDRWEKANIIVSASDLYERYFILESDHAHIANSQKMINSAMRMLSTLANLTANRILRQRFRLENISEWDRWENHLQERLRGFYANNEYSKRINTIDREGLQIFETRLFGRIVAAGVLVYLDTSYSMVREILRTFSMRGNDLEDNEDSAVRFLRQAFFLRHLPNSVPQNQKERRRLLHSLSDFERTILNRWWLQYTHHILFANQLFDEDHIKYLKEIMSW